jgi:choline-sulfatase
LLLAIFLSSCALRHGRPDVVVVTIDTLRADRVGCYGDSDAVTPNMDGLAREGILFENAVTPVPITLPSHSTIMTGLLPPNHGVRNNGSYVLPPSATTLAERFHEAGYRTGGFISAFVLNRQFGIAQGFDVYDDSLVTERAGTETVARAIRWLDRKDKRPFFLWVHLYEPHTPWTPPPPYLTLPLRSGYEREIAAADGALGGLIAHLRSRRLLEHTIVTVMADHGEGLNDHGEAEHGIFLYAETTRIPWIMRLPGHRAAGRKPRDLVATVDLAPTLCALAALAPPEQTDGISLEPALEGKPLARKTGIYLESMLPKENYGWSPLFGYQTPGWKWIRAPQSELYALGDNPARPAPERENVAAARPDTASVLDRRLEVAIRNMHPLSTGAQTVSQETNEQLRSLGYISAGDLVPQDKEDLPDPKTMIQAQKDIEAGKKALDDERFREAAAAFRRVLSQHQDNMVAVLGLGVALNKSAFYAEAEADYRAAVRERPGNMTAILGLADALFGQEKWAEALKLYPMTFADRTQGPVAWAHAATCRAMQGGWDDAEGTLAQARGMFSGKAQERVREVERELGAYKDLGGATADSLVLRRAVLASRLGLIAQCRRILSTPLAAGGPYEAERMTLLEGLYTNLDRPEEGLAVLDRLIAFAGRTPIRQIRRARLLLMAGRNGEALASFDGVVHDPSLKPEELRTVHYGRCVALAGLGRKAEALDALQEAVSCGYDDLGQLLTDTVLDPLREEPRMLELINQVSSRGRAVVRRN